MQGVNLSTHENQNTRPGGDSDPGGFSLSKVVATRLTLPEYQALERAAGALGETSSAVLRLALRDFLEYYERSLGGMP
jgi:hypothetical protein